MLFQRIKELRILKEISQRELSQIIGVTQQAIAKWETGKAEPDSATIIRLADFFGVSIDYLLGRTNIPNQVQEENTEYKIDNRFTDEELKLIQKFRQSSDKGKKIIETIVEIESNDEQAATGK